MRKLGVIVAFEQEVDILSLHAHREMVAGCPVTETTIGETPTVLVLCGIGPVNAGACAQMLVDRFHVDAILNIGLAGNGCDLPMGGALVVEKATYHDLYPTTFLDSSYPNVSVFNADEAMVQLAQQILQSMNIPFRTGVLATGSQFIDNANIKQDIIGRTGAHAIEMEGAAIAHIASKNDVPFCLVKIISDSAEESAGDEFDNTVEIADYLAHSTAFVKEFAQRFN